MLKLHDYQENCIEALFSYLKNTKEKKSCNPLMQIPTGGGKSLIQAETIKIILKYSPTACILCLCHSTEIIKQNYDEYISYTNFGNAGIYCSKLKRKDKTPVLFSSIQSIVKSDLHLRKIDIIIIDEAHLCNNKMSGQYRKFIDDVYKLNPGLRVIGMTATPWRMDGGCLIQGKEKLFSSIVYRITIKDLIDKGKLSTIVTPESSKLINIDYSGLEINRLRNDFTQSSMEDAVKKSLDKVVPEFNQLMKERKHILVFCPTIKICNIVKQILDSLGQTSELFIGNTPEKRRKLLKNDFSDAKIKYLLSVDALTTGFNVKAVDGLVVLRPTQSSSLWIQILGRGMRIYPGKKDCLLLDYGENISRHGPVENIEAPPQTSRKKGSGGESVYVKICPSCNSEIAMSCASCPECGFNYPVIERKFSKFEENKDVLFDGSNKKPEYYTYKLESIKATHLMSNDKLKLNIKTTKNKLSLLFFIDREPSKSELIRFFEKGLFRENENNKMEFDQRLELIGEIIKAIDYKNIEFIIDNINQYSNQLMPKYAAISYASGYPEVKNFLYE